MTDPTPEDELDELAEITPEDIESAKAFARKHGSKLFVELLGADVDPENDTK